MLNHRNNDVANTEHCGDFVHFQTRVATWPLFVRCLIHNIMQKQMFLYGYFIHYTVIEDHSTIISSHSTTLTALNSQLHLISFIFIPIFWCLNLNWTWTGHGSNWVWLQTNNIISPHVCDKHCMLAVVSRLSVSGVEDIRGLLLQKKLFCICVV